MARPYGYRLDEIFEQFRGQGQLPGEALAAWARCVDASNAAMEAVRSADPDSAEWEQADEEWITAFLAMKNAWRELTGRRWGEGGA